MYNDNTPQNPPPPPPNQGGTARSPYHPPVGQAANRAPKGCGFWAAIGLAVFFFITTIFMGGLFMTAVVGAAIKSAAVEDMGLQKHTVSGEGPNEVLLLPVDGIITGDAGGAVIRQGSARRIMRQLDEAAKDDNIKAIILSIDSPGGVITACDVLYNRLQSFDKPVVAYLNDTAASGGYYIAAAADAIIAHPTSITGNVGVIMPRLNVEELLDKLGVSVESIKSADHKDIGSPYRPMDPQELEYLQEIVQELHQRFVEVVREGLDRRGASYTDDDFALMTSGLPFTGKRAAELGMIDSTGYVSDAVRRAEQLSGVPNLRVVAYARPFRFMDLFGPSRLVIQTSLPAGLGDLEDIVQSPWPRFMYLWSSGGDALVSSYDYETEAPVETR